MSEQGSYLLPPWWYNPATQTGYRDARGARSTITHWPDWPSLSFAAKWFHIDAKGRSTEVPDA